jgi:hypothetical protein
MVVLLLGSFNRGNLLIVTAKTRVKISDPSELARIRNFGVPGLVVTTVDG